MKSNNKVKKNDKQEKPIEQFHIMIRWWVRFWRLIKQWWDRQVKRCKEFIERRPHSSFYLTKRRDSARSFKIAGYFRFSNEVWGTIWQNRKVFIKFLALYSVLSLIIVGALSQANYLSIRDSITSAGEGFGIGEVISIFTTTITSSNGDDATIASQIISGLLFLFGWLVMVFILRHQLSGNKIKLRDALYNAGAPIVATFVVLLLIVFQLLPLALSLLAYVVVSGIGAINWEIAIENMAAWCALSAIAVLTIYWLSSSFIALIVVTSPMGVYPWQAIKIAGDMVVGRRLKIVLRLLFMIVPLILLWAIVLIPMILLDNWINIYWLPLVPLVSLFLSTLSLIWISSYIFLLYRRLIDDDAPTVKK